MRKVIRLTESDLTRIVKQVLNEENLVLKTPKITDIRQGKGSDLAGGSKNEYGAEYGKCTKFYSRKKGTKKWVLGDKTLQYTIWKYYFSDKVSDKGWSKSCADQGIK
jgi:hypothetical protein